MSLIEKLWVPGLFPLAGLHGLLHDHFLCLLYGFLALLLYRILTANVIFRAFEVDSIPIKR
jgi:hypothetical protein